MTYTIKELSDIANVSTRTLRYYDEINLLKPHHINESGYRIYEHNEVDLLHQILIFKELGMPLGSIKSIVTSSDFDKVTALNNHYISLKKKHKRLEDIIETIDKTIRNLKGEIKMKDSEKFESFKAISIAENKEKYGKELDEKYDKKFVDQSNEKYQKMTKKQYDEVALLSNKINEELIKAVKTNDPRSAIAQNLCRLHKEWLMYYWPTYSKESHMALIEMYLEDERFTAYYEKIITGGTVFLRDAMKLYLEL